MMAPRNRRSDRRSPPPGPISPSQSAGRSRSARTGSATTRMAFATSRASSRRLTSITSSHGGRMAVTIRITSRRCALVAIGSRPTTSASTGRLGNRSAPDWRRSQTGRDQCQCCRWARGRVLSGEEFRGVSRGFLDQVGGMAIGSRFTDDTRGSRAIGEIQGFGFWSDPKYFLNLCQRSCFHFILV